MALISKPKHLDLLYNFNTIHWILFWWHHTLGKRMTPHVLGFIDCRDSDSISINQNPWQQHIHWHFINDYTLQDGCSIEWKQYFQPWFTWQHSKHAFECKYACVCMNAIFADLFLRAGHLPEAFMVQSEDMYSMSQANCCVSGCKPTIERFT